MMTKYLLIVFVLWGIMSPVHAGIEMSFGEKQTWWRAYYNSFLGGLGIEKSYALVIGVGEYNDNVFQSLPSEKDAIRVKDYLINEAGFDHVHLITGDKVTLAKVSRLMFDDYPSILTPKDRFLFYWSGHGISIGDLRKQGFLALQNSQENRVSTMLSMNDLSQWDKRFKAKQTLYVLDSCFSGIAATTTMSVTSRDQTIERVSRQSSQLLVAGLADEQTIAIGDIDGGVFTRAFLDGLRGQADTDKGVFKKDGVVTAHELVEYVRERVDHERIRVGWPDPITPRLANFPTRHQKGDFFFVADKRILKRPQALKQGSQTKVVATGVSARSHTQPKKPPRSKQIRNGHLIDYGDGTIFDTRTNLVWRKCSEGQNPQNCSGAANLYSWADAIRYSNGSNGWRMPTINELRTLNVKGKTPSINRTIFSNTHNFSVSWSSTEMNQYDTNAFDFGYGKPIVINKDNLKELRLVKGR